MVNISEIQSDTTKTIVQVAVAPSIGLRGQRAKKTVRVLLARITTMTTRIALATHLSLVRIVKVERHKLKAPGKKDSQEE